MKQINIISLLTILMCMVGAKTFAHKISVKNSDGKTIYYNFNSDGSSVSVTYLGTSYDYYSNEYSGEIVIPKTITYNSRTYFVTSIDDMAFYNCSGLTSVTIPSSVTSSGEMAFWGCSGLKKVIAADIKNWCNIKFSSSSDNPLSYAHHLYSDENTEITELVIPDEVTSIGSYAFSGCSALTSVTIPNSLTSIGSEAFYNCSGLTSVTWNAKNYPDFNNYTSGPFYRIRTNITEFIIGDEVTSIPAYMCYGMSNLKSVTIPNSVTSIGTYAFYYCSRLTSVTIGNGVTSIGSQAFSNCSGLTSVTIPNGVTSIGSQAFSSCSRLTSVTIGNGVTSIGSKAFSGCWFLTSVTIPNSVTSIGSYAFEKCSGLTSVTIPNSVTSIGSSAFGECSNLTEIKVDNDNSTYDSRNDCNAIIKTSSNTLIAGCKNTIIPNSVTSIGNYAFSGCSGLTSVTIPNSVTSIGSQAFSGCSGLKSITWNAKNYPAFFNYSDNPFYDIRTQITEFVISDEVISIPAYMCYEMSNLKSMTIPNSVTSIGTSAFEGCSSLTSVTIGNGVTSIGYSAFAYCSSLASVTIPNNVTSINSRAFYNTTIKSLTIGSGIQTIASDAFSYSSSANGEAPVKVIWLANTPPSGYENVKGTVNYVANNQYTKLSNATVYPFLNSMFEVGGIKYVPVSPSERTCDAIDCMYDTSAENINIGETVSYKGVSLNVKDIKPYTCYMNQSIKSVVISNGGNIGNYAFYKCDNIKGDVYVKNSGYIGSYAFQGCSAITQATITNDGYIGSYAFQGCSAITQATIANNGYINDYAFSECSNITTLDISNKGDIKSYAFYKCGSNQTIPLVNISNDGSIGQYAFSQTGMEKAIIKNNGEIGNSAFSSCPKLKTVELGQDITSVGSSAFQVCTKLGSIEIPDNVKTLGTGAFSGCTSLKSAKTGNGVSLLNTQTFSGCTSLENVEIGTNITKISGKSGTSKNYGCFYNCSSLEQIKVPGNVKEIEDYVFNGCTGLKNVIIDNADTELKLGSNGSNPIFSSCPLDSVYIGRNISYPTASSYGYSPFYRNTSLRTVHITDKETEISENEFYGCTNLKNVRIGDGVTYIGNWAFSGCSSIEYFSFGSAMQSIGKEAFSDCTAMTKLISHAMTPPVCDSQALDDISKWVCTLSVPKGTVSSYQQAAQWKEFFFIDEGATGIQRTVSNDSKSFRTYNINGYEQNGQQRGLNIIRMSDGTVKKVMVK